MSHVCTKWCAAQNRQGRGGRYSWVAHEYSCSAQLICLLTSHEHEVLKQTLVLTWVSMRNPVFFGWAEHEYELAPVQLIVFRKTTCNFGNFWLFGQYLVQFRVHSMQKGLFRTFSSILFRNGGYLRRWAWVRVNVLGNEYEWAWVLTFGHRAHEYEFEGQIQNFGWVWVSKSGLLCLWVNVSWAWAEMFCPPLGRCGQSSFSSNFARHVFESNGNLFLHRIWWNMYRHNHGFLLLQLSQFRPLLMSKYEFKAKSLHCPPIRLLSLDIAVLVNRTVFRTTIQTGLNLVV